MGRAAGGVRTRGPHERFRLDAERHPDALADRQGGLAAARRRRLGRRGLRAFTWWSGPINAESATAFTPGQFDTQGIVPIGYAVFAMALGIAVGTVARRTLPAIAVVLGGFIGLRLVIANLLRPHYMAAVTTYFSVTGTFTPAGQAWVLSQGGVSPTGQVVGRGWGDLEPALPAACQRLLPGAPTAKSDASMTSVFSCMQAHGWRGFVTYQPGRGTGRSRESRPGSTSCWRRR